MTEKELTNLKQLPVPPPGAGAMVIAREAALEAFDASSASAASTTQGTDGEIRLTPRPHGAARRKPMTFTRSQYALAASIAALVAAAPLAFQMGRGELQPLFEDMQAAPREAEPAGTRIADLDAKAARDIERREIKAGATAEKKDAGKAAGPSAGHDQPGQSQAVLAEPVPVPSDGLGAAGQPEQRPQGIDVEEKLAAPAQPAKRKELKPFGLGAVTRSDAPAGPGIAGLDAATGQRMLAPNAPIAGFVDGRAGAEAPASSAYNPYAHMDEAERQRALAEQEFRDRFEAKEQSPIKQVAVEPVSTFSIDVDTASYAFVRRALNSARLPPKDAVRVEEMINYFPYAYPKPDAADVPFKPTVTVVQSPWNSSNQLVHVAIKGYELAGVERPRANLVLLMDVSGSMSSADKLPLVKNAFKMLVEELKPDDTVAIVTYASGSGVLLEPTRIAERGKIIGAIERLGAAGSTAGAEGIQDAYRLAEQNFDKAAVNRLILATDGDFNVGVTRQDELKGLIERKRDKGIFLSILGVGQGNYNDSLMQTLAQNGNGTAAYVDTLNEARKVLVDEASSTLFTIAKDVKIQVEWNPAQVSEYRLIGYETRALRREDFNNDKVDAGDIGSGHTVTAIYEVTPAGAPAMVDGLRYSAPKTASAEPAPAVLDDAKAQELGFLKLRYKLPKEDASKLVSLPITTPAGDGRIEAASAEARFSVAVAAFGQLLKGSPYVKSLSYDDVIALAQSARGEDAFGYRAEFINLVRMAKLAQP